VSEAASLDYLGAMDREAIARAERRRQALEALAFERERAAALRERLDAIVAEIDGPAVDAAAFARMTPEEIEVVRPAVQEAEAEPAVDDPEAEAERAAQLAWLEEEIVRLGEEIDSSAARQGAFERYLDALGGP
jgi:hypothetical protein